jgi:hypothetical protein
VDKALKGLGRWLGATWAWSKALMGRMFLVVALALAVLLLAADRLFASGWPHWLAATLPRGIRSTTTPGALPAVFPLAAFIVIVLVAYSVYVWLPWLGWLVPVTAAAASIMIVVDLPDALNHRQAVPVDLWVRLPAAALLTILFAKFLLLHRHAVGAYARERAAPPSYLLLPTQQEDLDELRSLITDVNYDRVLPIQGRQGEGKSFLIRELEREWDGRRGTPVVVIVDVWQQQKEADLQAAILEALLSHRAYMARLTWLRVPAIFLLERWIAALREARSNLELGLRNSKANFELRFDVPGIQWQRHLERITAHRGRLPGGAVVVLDELDRATPAVTQAALTLARRSVGIPGVTAVIPYVRAQIRYKVFNPLQTVLPDLESSMDAVLYDDRFGRRQDDDPDSTRPDTILAFWDDLRRKFWMDQQGRDWSASAENAEDQPTARESSQERRANSPSRDRQDPSVVLTAGFLGKPPAGDNALAMALRFGVFADAQEPHRERLQRLFEEKYLSAAGITVRPPGPRDLAAMVTTHFPALARMVCKLLSRSWSRAKPKPQALDAVAPAVQRGLENWLESKPTLVRPPIRALLGVLHDNLGRAVSLAEERGKSLSAQEVATLAAAAYDTAALVYGAAGGLP